MDNKKKFSSYYVLFRSFCDSCKGIKTAFYLDSELQSREINTPPRSRGYKHETKGRPQGSKRNYKVLWRILVSSIVHVAVCVIAQFGFIPLLTWLTNLTVNIYFATIVISSFSYAIAGIVIFFCKIINFVIFQDIGESVFKYINGRCMFTRNISEVLSDALFSTGFEFIFLLQAQAIAYIPTEIIAIPCHLLFMSLLYSLYIFEYKWCNMNLTFQSRLYLIEHNWIYYFGFGLPLVLLTNYFESYIANVTIFSLAFPFFLISGSIATPVESEIFPLQIFSTSVGVITEVLKILFSLFKTPNSKPIKKS